MWRAGQVDGAPLSLGGGPAPSRTVRMARPSRGVGISLAALSSVTFATSGPLAKFVIDAGFSAVQVTLIRLIASTALILAGVAVFRPSALRLHRRDLPTIIGFGLFGVAGAQAFFFVAVARMPVAIAMLLEFTAPVFVALWVRFVRHRHLGPVVWGGIAIALAGLAIVVEIWRIGGLDLIGCLAALASAVCSAGYFLIGERAVAHREPTSVLAGGLVVGLVVIAAVSPPWLLPLGRLGVREVVVTSLPVAVVIGLLVIVSTVVPYLAGLTSLRHLRPAAASVLGLIEAPVAAAIAWWLLHQAMSPVQVFGGVLVLAGAALVQVATRAADRSLTPDRTARIRAVVDGFATPAVHDGTAAESKEASDDHGTLTRGDPSPPDDRVGTAG